MSCSEASIVYDELFGEYVCIDTGEVIEERVVDQGLNGERITMMNTLIGLESVHD